MARPHLSSADPKKANGGAASEATDPSVAPGMSTCRRTGARPISAKGVVGAGAAAKKSPASTTRRRATPAAKSTAGEKKKVRKRKDSGKAGCYTVAARHSVDSVKLDKQQ